MARCRAGTVCEHDCGMPSSRRWQDQFAPQNNVAVVNLDRFGFVRSDSFCDRVVYSVAIPSERVNLIPTITKKRDPNRHGLIDSERRSCHKPRRRDLMQVSLAKCSRIEEDEIASHFIHWSDIDDAIPVDQVTPGGVSCKFRIQLCRLRCVS